MGYGDWIMATSQIRTLNLRTGRPVFVIGRGGRPQWSEVFQNNPRITQHRNMPHALLQNGSGHRPYIKAKLPERWIWQAWDKAPGEIYLSPAEKNFAEPHRGMVLIEPNTKVDGGNKAWPWDRWQAVVEAFPSGTFVQVGVGNRWLDRARIVHTSFRQAMAVLSVCKAFVGTEGGLHHAAAALGVPSVVLFSEFISPAITGYESHLNLRHAGEACGSRLPCRGCRESMERITVDEVITNLKEILQ